MASEDASQGPAGVGLRTQTKSDEENSKTASPEPVAFTDDLDWDGPDDPDNPHTWPVWQRILHSAIPALWSFGLCTGISTLVAAVPLLQARFDVSRNVALLPVSLYTVGFSIGPCVASPLSELYGRRWIYWTNFPMLVTFNAIAAASDNFVVLVLFRFLAGLGGSGILGVAAGTLSDIWDTKDAGRVGVPYILAPFLGPTLGPLIGAYILDQYDDDWRWTIWVLLLILAPVAIMILFMKETSKSRILYLRHKKTQDSLEKSSSSHVEAIQKGLLRPLHMTIFEPLSLFLALYNAYSFAMIFSFFGSYAYVYSTVYHFNMKQIGLCYIPVIVGFLFAVATFGYFDATKYQKEVAKSNDNIDPKHRLYAALFGSWLVPVGLFWYAWTPRDGIHWIVPVLAGLFVGWGMLAGFLSSLAYIIDVYGAVNSASAIAANGVLRFLLGAAFPQFIIQIYQSKMGIHWAGSIFAFISVIMVPVPWFFYYRGRRLIERSHYPTKYNQPS